MKTISVYRFLTATLLATLCTTICYAHTNAIDSSNNDIVLVIPETMDENPIVRAPDEFEPIFDLEDEELTPAQIEARDQKKQIQNNDALEAPSDFIPSTVNPTSPRQLTDQSHQAITTNVLHNTEEKRQDAQLIDNTFTDALKAFRSRDLTTLEELKTQLKHHPLRDYAALWALLIQADADYPNRTIQDKILRFIQHHDGQYIAERARTDFARIAAKNDDPKMFMRLYRGLHWNRSESDIACYNQLFELRYSPNKSTLSSAKRMLVQTRTPTGNACKLLSESVRSKDPSWTWINVLVLMQQKRFSYAKTILKEMPQNQLRISKKEAFAILDNPKRWLKRNHKKLKQKPARLLVLAVLRLAAVSPQDAALVAQSVHPKLSAQIRAIIWGRIGYEAALDQESKTLSWYAKAGALLGKGEFTVAGDEILLWQARTALRVAGAHTQLKAIAKLPKHLRQSSTWVYWRARALQQTGSPKTASKLLQSLIDGHSFYALLARDALGLSYMPVTQQIKPTVLPQSRDRFNTNPSIQRALRFYALDMIYEGNREWNWAMRGMKKRDRLELAEYARTIGLTHRQINTAASTGGQIVLPLLYPQAHAKEITTAASVADLPLAWVYGLIRQESRFVRVAKSSVGAQGLMQVMPKTGRWVAKKIALANYNDNHLVQLQTNLLIGTQYLKLVADSFEGNVVLTTAAYNAGPLRAQQWRSTLDHPIDAAAFIETIPFGETRNYVAKVTTNMIYYSLYDDKPLRLSNLLGTISPKPVDQSPLP